MPTLTLKTGSLFGLPRRSSRANLQVNAFGKFSLLGLSPLHQYLSCPWNCLLIQDPSVQLLNKIPSLAYGNPLWCIPGPAVCGGAGQKNKLIRNTANHGMLLARVCQETKKQEEKR